MKGRFQDFVVVLVYWLIIPPGEYFFLISPAMGYEESTSLLISGVLVLVPLGVLPGTLRRKKQSAENDRPVSDALS